MGALEYQMVDAADVFLSGAVEPLVAQPRDLHGSRSCGDLVHLPRISCKGEL